MANAGRYRGVPGKKDTRSCHCDMANTKEIKDRPTKVVTEYVAMLKEASRRMIYLLHFPCYFEKNQWIDLQSGTSWSLVFDVSGVIRSPVGWILHRWVWVFTEQKSLHLAPGQEIRREGGKKSLFFQHYVICRWSHTQIYTKSAYVHRIGKWLFFSLLFVTLGWKISVFNKTMFTINQMSDNRVKI